MIVPYREDISLGDFRLLHGIRQYNIACVDEKTDGTGFGIVMTVSIFCMMVRTILFFRMCVFMPKYRTANRCI